MSNLPAPLMDAALLARLQQDADINSRVQEAQARSSGLLQRAAVQQRNAGLSASAAGSSSHIDAHLDLGDDAYYYGSEQGYGSSMGGSAGPAAAAAAGQSTPSRRSATSSSSAAVAAPLSPKVRAVLHAGAAARRSAGLDAEELMGFVPSAAGGAAGGRPSSRAAAATGAAGAGGSGIASSQAGLSSKIPRPGGGHGGAAAAAAAEGSGGSGSSSSSSSVPYIDPSLPAEAQISLLHSHLRMKEKELVELQSAGLSLKRERDQAVHSLNASSEERGRLGKAVAAAEAALVKAKRAA